MGARGCLWVRLVGEGRGSSSWVRLVAYHLLFSFFASFFMIAAFHGDFNDINYIFSPHPIFLQSKCIMLYQLPGKQVKKRVIKKSCTFVVF